MTRIPDFEHQHYAHCESGVMSSLLRHKRLDLSEPMVFGLGGALSFAFLPFLKFGNMPLVSYRMFPGHIAKKFPRQIGAEYFRKTYRNPDQAMAELDQFLENGQMVGLQTSAYHTTYFPPEMRFHFNAHNIICVGREGTEYLVSDPVFDRVQRIGRDDLTKARFAKGLSAPRGLAHFPIQVPESLDLEKQIKKAIKKTVRMMLHAPVPWIGIKGIRHLARRVTRLAAGADDRYVRLFMGNIVRMQEEIGTGGGGFRFMYASFLQEAHDITGWSVLQEASNRMTEAGDTWRRFALACARVIKNKGRNGHPGQLAELLLQCAEKERGIYAMLKGVG